MRSDQDETIAAMLEWNIVLFVAEKCGGTGVCGFAEYGDIGEHLLNSDIHDFHEFLTAVENVLGVELDLVRIARDFREHRPLAAGDVARVLLDAVPAPGNIEEGTTVSSEKIRLHSDGLGERVSVITTK